jgi:hypothetical protein
MAEDAGATADPADHGAEVLDLVLDRETVAVAAVAARAPPSPVIGGCGACGASASARPATVLRSLNAPPMRRSTGQCRSAPRCRCHRRKSRYRAWPASSSPDRIGRTPPATGSANDGGLVAPVGRARRSGWGARCWRSQGRVILDTSHPDATRRAPSSVVVRIPLRTGAAVVPATAHATIRARRQSWAWEI